MPRWIPISLFLPYDVFGQTEPWRRCFDAAVADACRELELALNLSKVACLSKFSIDTQACQLLMQNPARSASMESRIALRHYHCYDGKEWATQTAFF